MKKLRHLSVYKMNFMVLCILFCASLSAQEFDAVLVRDISMENLLIGKCAKMDSNLIFKIWDDDMNDNFEDIGIDNITIVDKKTRQIGTTKWKEKLVFQFNEIFFEITKDSSVLRLKQIEQAPLAVDINLWSTIPDHFVMNDIDNDTIIDISTIFNTNKDYIYFSFWATYCEPCIKELPYFDLFLKSNERKIQFVHICIDSDKEKAKDILKKYAPPGLYAYCSRMNMEYLNAYYFPYGFFYNKHRVLVGGFNGANALFNYLRKH